MLPLRIALAVTALAACCARAQESRPADSPARFRDTVLRLESSEPAKIAWGAWHARESSERRTLPHLTTALVRTVEIEDALERRCTALVVLDALLALEWTATLTELEPFLSDPETRRPALALLARSGNEHIAFFRKLLAGARDAAERQLAGNVLARAKAPGLAAEALDNLAFSIEVTVTDSSAPGWSSGSGLHTITLPETPPAGPSGFPPAPCFRWSEPGKIDGVAVAGSNGPLWLQRIVPGRPYSIVGGTFLGANKLQRTLELDWIADLLDARTESLGIETLTNEAIAWRGARAFERDLARIRQTLSDRHAALVARLVRAKLVTPEEAKALTCKVEVLVRDDRGDQREPLPQLGFTLRER